MRIRDDGQNLFLVNGSGGFQILAPADSHGYCAVLGKIPSLGTYECFGTFLFDIALDNGISPARHVYLAAGESGVAAADVKLRDFKARWGSCDASGNISLNWRLCMVPPDLRQYVYIHELCHRMYFDHSPAFWRAVGTFCPDYRTARRRLKEYSFLMLLYRSGEKRG